MRNALVVVMVAVLIGAGLVGVAASQPSTTPPYLTDLTNKVGIIGADVLTIKDNVTLLRADVATLQSDVADVKDKLDSVPVMECSHDMVTLYENGEVFVTNNWHWDDTEIIQEYELAQFHVDVMVAFVTAPEEVSINWGWNDAIHTWYKVNEETITADGVYSYAFTAEGFSIGVGGLGEGDFVTVAYSATWTYVPLNVPI